MYIELGRIAQGYKDTKGTNTVNFMNLEEISNIIEDRTITYARIVVNYRPQKGDPNRVIIRKSHQLSLQTHHQDRRPHYLQGHVEKRHFHPGSLIRL